MEAIIIAAITATASIVVAIIQARSAHRQALTLRQSATVESAPKPDSASRSPSDSRPDPAPPLPQRSSPEAVATEPWTPPVSETAPSASTVSEPSTPVTVGGPAAYKVRRRSWYVSVVVCSLAFLGLLMINEDLALIIVVAVIPTITLLLALRFPIPWGGAAVAVGILHGEVYLGYWILGGSFGDDDLAISLMVYIGNAIGVSLIAFLRLRHLSRRST